MTERELRRLRRDDLIDIIYALKSSETDLLTKVENLNEKIAQEQQTSDDLRKQLEERQIRMQELGNLAAVAADVTGLLDAGQRTADIYLDEVKRRRDECAEEIARMTMEADEKANNITKKAKEDALKIILKAKITSNRIKSGTQV